MSNRNLFARSALAVAIVIAVTGSLVTSSPLPAGAHAIIDLQSSDAIVGRTSAMTLEIQHGCINGGGGTMKVVAQFTAPFGDGDLDHDWRGATILDRTDDSSDSALAVSGGRLRRCGFPNVQ